MPDVAALGNHIGLPLQLPEPGVTLFEALDLSTLDGTDFILDTESLSILSSCQKKILIDFGPLEC